MADPLNIIHPCNFFRRPIHETTTQRDKKVGTGMGWHKDLIERTIFCAVRVALPVWRTTPNTVLHKELGIPPAVILLQQKRLRASAHI